MNTDISAKRLYGIRGAFCAQNTAEDIIAQTGILFRSIVSENNLDTDDIVSIQFTVTQDIDVLNPAAALRKADAGADFSNCALFCAGEPFVKGGLSHVIRVLVTAYLPQKSQIHHIYRNGAEVLRPDFARR